MASRAVEDAIGSYLAANWNRCPILTENMQGEAPSGGEPFLVVQYPVSNITRESVGSRLYWETGGFRILINVSRGEGTATIRAWGEELANLFRDRAIGPVNCLVPSEPFTDDQSDRGNFFAGSMVVPFNRSFVG